MQGLNINLLFKFCPQSFSSLWAIISFHLVDSTTTSWNNNRNLLPVDHKILHLINAHLKFKSQVWDSVVCWGDCDIAVIELVGCSLKELVKRFVSVQFKTIWFTSTLNYSVQFSFERFDSIQFWMVEFASISTGLFHFGSVHLSQNYLVQFSFEWFVSHQPRTVWFSSVLNGLIQSSPHSQFSSLKT